MPTLNWIGKEAVVKHHKEVPVRLLELVPELSCGDADLRLSPQAMQRAARRARELAAQTGTAVVIMRNGVLEHIHPEPETSGLPVQDPPTPYSDSP